MQENNSELGFRVVVFFKNKYLLLFKKPKK